MPAAAMSSGAGGAGHGYLYCNEADLPRPLRSNHSGTRYMAPLLLLGLSLLRSTQAEPTESRCMCSVCACVYGVA